jgi:hypothetical protein
MFWKKYGVRLGMKRIGCAGFLNNVIGTVDLEMPRAAVPVIEAYEGYKSTAAL